MPNKSSVVRPSLLGSSKLRKLDFSELAPGAMAPETLIDLLRWIDSVKLSRPKKILHRDFADGVLVAEIMAHHFPACVEIHNYVASNNMKGKLKNWKLLNAKVLPKFGFTIPALKESTTNSLQVSNSHFR